MREILFRGKRLDNGEWVEGFLVQAIGGGFWIDCYHTAHMPTIYFVDPTTVGQYTGMTDKNGVDIFEGDIIRTHYANAHKADFVEQVVFHNGRFCALFQFPENGKMWSGLADGISHLPQERMAYMEWCEVIGNIHDNPELLGEADDA